jgi:chorismate synthase
MSRRKPGQSVQFQRKEPDAVQFYLVYLKVNYWHPIGFIIPNTNQKSDDYSHIKDNYRPSHADYVMTKKYGFRDYRGGRSSARETASRVVAGAIAKQMLPKKYMRMCLQ